MRRGIGIGLVVAAALSGSLIAGCGSSSVSGVVDPVARAATVSNHAPGERIKLLMHLSTPALPTPIVATGDGAFDVANRSGSFNLAMNFGNIPQLTQVLGSSTIRIQEIVNGLTIYLKLPEALSRNPALHGKPWLKINLATIGQSVGVPGLSSLLSNPTSSDPSQFLRYLRATSGGVTKVGTQTVDGFQTTEYRAKIALSRVPNGFPAASRAQVRKTIAALEQLAHVRLLPMNVWVDGQHLVRRMNFSFDETVTGQTLAASVQIDIPQYGPQPSPQPPPAGQVADLTGGLGMSSGSGGSAGGA
jgi:hypothetical protein